MMRLGSTFIVCAALLSGCADAPITASQLQDDGQLRPDLDASAALFSAKKAEKATMQAQPIALSALLAPQAEGALEDATTFSSRKDGVHLHMRADGLEDSLELAVVWTHGAEVAEELTQLPASETLVMAASREFERGDEGLWSVEVFALVPEGRAKLLSREFKVTR